MSHVWVVLSQNVLCPEIDPEIKIFATKEKASEHYRRYFRECLSDLRNLYPDAYKDWTFGETDYLDFIDFKLMGPDTWEGHERMRVTKKAIQ